MTRKDVVIDLENPGMDYVSRKAVLIGLASIAKAKAKSDAQKSMMGRAIFFVEQLPPGAPARKMGKWIVETDCEGKTRSCICNQCGYKTALYTWKNPNYCEECGAKMEE